MAGRDDHGTVEVEHHEGVDLVWLLGEHDMSTTQSLDEVLVDSIASGRGVVVSLAEAEFIDSGVINLLFKSNRMLRERDRSLVVHVNTASVVRRVLEVTNVFDALPCTGDVETAVVLASRRGSDPSSWNMP